MGKSYLFLFILCIITFVSCNDDDPLKKEIDRIEAELNAQKMLIQALQENITIKNITETKDGYTAVFSNNSEVFLSKEKNSQITTIGSNKHWLINGKDTGIEANTSNSLDSELQSITIDGEGFWIINNGKTQIKANNLNPSNGTPVIINIIFTPSFFYFYFSDNTLIKIINQSAVSVTLHKNMSLPHYPKSLKILGIGNSFTEDATDFLPTIVGAAGLKEVILGRAIIGGGSLKHHFDNYQNNSSVYIFQTSKSGEWWTTVSTTYPLKKAISYTDWDIIIFQQVSGDAGRYQTYQPYLDNLIKIVKLNCKNAGVILGWQMTWAYGSQSTHDSFPFYDRDQQKMYNAITKATKTMMLHTGVDLIIPSGTAIQNLRTSSLNNSPLDLTRDGHHIDYGAGRYTLACTWFQTLIAPCFHTSITDTSFETANGNVYVTKKNYQTCQLAAQYACNDKFTITTISQ